MALPKNGTLKRRGRGQARPMVNVRPVRMTLPQAYRILGTSKSTALKLLKEDIFTCQVDRPGGIRMLFVDEIELWLTLLGTAEERIEKLRAFRMAKCRYIPVARK